MAYAILQRDLSPPSLEQLKRAYRVLPTLRDLDAQTSLNDAYGVLLKGLEELDASTLREALWREGIPTEVVREGALPAIPQAHTLVKAMFEPDQLVATDPMQRTIAIPWNTVLFMAAGTVLVREMRRVKSTSAESLVRVPGMAYDTIDEVKSKEEEKYQLMADICLAGGLQRFTLPVETFDFGYLKNRRTDNPGLNLAFFVQDVAQFAPHAGLNRGAFNLCQQDAKPFVYPSKAAYFEEMTWMLWRSTPAE